MTDIDRYQRENLRMECLKLAAQNDPDFSINEMKGAAEALYNYVAGADQPEPCPPDYYPEDVVPEEPAYENAFDITGKVAPLKWDSVTSTGIAQPVRTVTMEQIQNTIAEEHYLNLGEALKVSLVPNSGLALTTICVLVLKNGYTVIGQSACADPAKYDEQLGRQIAYNDAVRQVWPLLGYELKSLLSFQRQMQEVAEVRD